MTLKPGDIAPDFTLPDKDGTPHTLTSYRGTWVLLYFYPKDDTPGCTIEACTLRDAFPAFEKLNITILGISADSEKKHLAFTKKYTLPFTLLSDTTHEVLERYGVWQEKKMMGKTYMGIVRSSVLINPQGVIAKTYTKVVPIDHADEVLTDTKELSSTPL